MERIRAMSKRLEVRRTKTDGSTTPPPPKKYYLTADFFDFIQAPDHKWRTRGQQLTICEVVDDPKHNTTPAKQQKKLQWLVDEMHRIAEDPATFHRSLLCQLSLILAFQHLETTIFSPLPKNKLRDGWIDTIKALSTRLTVEAAKQLTADTRAVLHEFKNLQKTFEFVEEIGKEIGLRFVDDWTTEIGAIKAKEFVAKFNHESKKEIENLSRIKLPFTQEASHKLAICARHLRPLVAQALTVHAQEVYNKAFELNIQVNSLVARLQNKLEVASSALDRTDFRAYGTGKVPPPPPHSFPRFLPNISIPDPDPLLVLDEESYRLILTAYADYYSQLERMIPQWVEICEMLEMWQRTCVKANAHIQTKGPIPAVGSRTPRASTSYATDPAAAGGGIPATSLQHRLTHSSYSSASVSNTSGSPRQELTPPPARGSPSLVLPQSATSGRVRSVTAPLGASSTPSSRPHSISSPSIPLPLPAPPTSPTSAAGYSTIYNQVSSASVSASTSSSPPPSSQSSITSSPTYSQSPITSSPPSPLSDVYSSPFGMETMDHISEELDHLKYL